MDILKLLQDCIKNYDLNIKTLRDIAFAICISDKLNGSNKIELDVDKFVESDSELSWVEILKLLGIEPQSKGCSKLPRVQKLRVISDILSLCLHDKVEDLTLSCSSSKKVANVLGVSLSYADYSDENSCYENLKKIESTLEDNSLDLSSLSDLYKRLCVYTNKIITIGEFNLPSDISNILIPDEIFNNLGKKCTTSELIAFMNDNGFSIEDYTSYILDIYCFNLVPLVIKLFDKIREKNEAMFNLILIRANSYAGNYLPIGMYSLNNYTYRLTAFHNVPSYLTRKINMVFSESSPFSETTILGCIVLLYFIRKFSIKKEYILSEMEVLLNECNSIR